MQKIVSFKVAKYLKKIGYPQGITDNYYDIDKELNSHFSDEAKPLLCDAPTYIDIWLWLWKEKIIELSLDYGIRMNDIDETLHCYPLKYHDKSHPSMKYIIQEMNREDNGNCCSKGHLHEHADPEEAIANTIDFLVNNKIIRKKDGKNL